MLSTICWKVCLNKWAESQRTHKATVCTQETLTALQLRSVHITMRLTKQRDTFLSSSTQNMPIKQKLVLNHQQGWNA